MLCSVVLSACCKLPSLPFWLVWFGQGMLSLACDTVRGTSRLRSPLDA